MKRHYTGPLKFETPEQLIGIEIDGHKVAVAEFAPSPLPGGGIRFKTIASVMLDNGDYTNVCMHCGPGNDGSVSPTVQAVNGHIRKYHSQHSRLARLARERVTNGGINGIPAGVDLSQITLLDAVKMARRVEMLQAQIAGLREQINRLEAEKRDLLKERRDRSKAADMLRRALDGLAE